MPKAQNKGKTFEHELKSCFEKSGAYVIRLKDSATSYGRGGEGMARFTPSNPYDMIVYDFPRMFCLELKSTKATSIGIQRSPEDKPNMIKAKQIASLIKASEFKGVVPGFILNFRKNEGKADKSYSETTYFLSIQNFSQFLFDTEKQSINEKDVITYGGIEIVSPLKRTRCSYNTTEFLESFRKEDD